MIRGAQNDDGDIFACDLSKGMTIEYVVPTPDGPVKMYPVLTKVLRHPSDISTVRIRGTVPGYATMPAFRIHEKLPFDALVQVTHDSAITDDGDGQGGGALYVDSELVRIGRPTISAFRRSFV